MKHWSLLNSHALVYMTAKSFGVAGLPKAALDKMREILKSGATKHDPADAPEVVWTFDQQFVDTRGDPVRILLAEYCVENVKVLVANLNFDKLMRSTELSADMVMALAGRDAVPKKEPEAGTSGTLLPGCGSLICGICLEEAASTE